MNSLTGKKERSNDIGWPSDLIERISGEHQGDGSTADDRPNSNHQDENNVVASALGSNRSARPSGQSMTFVDIGSINVQQQAGDGGTREGVSVWASS